MARWMWLLWWSFWGWHSIVWSWPLLQGGPRPRLSLNVRNSAMPPQEPKLQRSRRRPNKNTPNPLVTQNQPVSREGRLEPKLQRSRRRPKKNTPNPPVIQNQPVSREDRLEQQCQVLQTKLSMKRRLARTSLHHMLRLKEENALLKHALSSYLADTDIKGMSLRIATDTRAIRFAEDTSWRLLDGYVAIPLDRWRAMEDLSQDMFLYQTIVDHLLREGSLRVRYPQTNDRDNHRRRLPFTRLWGDIVATMILVRNESDI